jgi:hypothetical protein
MHGRENKCLQDFVEVNGSKKSASRSGVYGRIQNDSWINRMGGYRLHSSGSEQGQVGRSCAYDN